MVPLPYPRPSSPCKHNWKVCDVIKFRGSADLPMDLDAVCYMSQIYRICKLCYKQDDHRVRGEWTMSDAKEVFEGEVK